MNNRNIKLWSYNQANQFFESGTYKSNGVKKK